MSLFGENLQYYRKRDGLTQEQLAERLEVSRQTVSKWEAGTSYAEMEKILQLCDIFSCDMACRYTRREFPLERLFLFFRIKITDGRMLFFIMLVLHPFYNKDEDSDCKRGVQSGEQPGQERSR